MGPGLPVSLLLLMTGFLAVAGPVAPGVAMSPALVTQSPDCAFPRVDRCPDPSTATILVTYVVGSTPMEAGGGLGLSLGNVLGGKYRTALRFRWPALQSLNPGGFEFVSAETSRPGVDAHVLTSDDGVLILLDGQLRMGDRLIATLGDRSQGGGGMRAPGIPLRASLMIRENLAGASGNFEYLDQKYGISFPAIETHGGIADNFLVTLPSEAIAGGLTTVTIRAMSGLEGITSNSVPVKDHTGEIVLDSTDPLFSAPVSTRFSLADAGVLHVPVVLRTPGRQRVEVRGWSPDGLLAGKSNPVLVQSSMPPLRTFWGQLHVHTGASFDGAGEVEDAFLSARDRAGYDFLAVSDHCKTRYFDFTSATEIADSFDEPGRFTTFPAYEWTNVSEGHRHVIYPDAADGIAGCEMLREGATGLVSAPTLESLDQAAAARGAVLIVHHSLWSGRFNRPINDFTFGDLATPPVSQTLLEIYSEHGRSEFFDNRPYIIQGRSSRQQPPSVPSSFQDAMRLGWQFGVTAGSDHHLAQAGAWIGINFGTDRVRYSRHGVTAVLSRENTRASLFQALKERRTYGTTGARIRLRVTGNGKPMGSLVSATGAALIKVDVAATAPLLDITLIRDGLEGTAVWTAPKGVEHACIQFRDLTRDSSPTSYYVRIHQEDEHFAWSSPLWYVRHNASPARRSHLAPIEITESYCDD